MALFENLAGFFNSRPPLAVFMICLASFAITLITLAHVVKSRDLPNPDITEDWNTMLEKFSNLQFCIGESYSLKGNSSLPKLNTGEKSVAENYENIHNTIHTKVSQTLGTFDPKDRTQEKLNKVNKRDVAAGLKYFKRDSDEEGNKASISSSPYTNDVPASNTQVSYLKAENVTVSLSFIYIPQPDDKTLDSLHFIAAVTAHQMKLDVSAKVKGDESFNVYINLPHNLSLSTCEETKGHRCIQYRVPACITFQGPSYLLPTTLKPNQEVCAAYSDPSVQGTYYKIKSGTFTETAKNDWCPEGSRLLPQYTIDDSLTVFLSMHEKSMINLHLMRTSYFLFVMVVTLFCYALIKGRPPKSKSPHIAYDKVSSSA